MKFLHVLIFLSLNFLYSCSGGDSKEDRPNSKKESLKYTTDQAVTKRIIGQWEKMLSPEYMRINEDGTFGRYGIGEESIDFDPNNVIEQANWKVVKGRLELTYKDGKKKYLDIKMDEYIDKGLDDFLILGNYNPKKDGNREDFEQEHTYMRSETKEDRSESREMLAALLAEALIGRWVLQKKEEIGFIFNADGSFERFGKADQQDFYQRSDLPQKGRWKLEGNDVIIFSDKKGAEFAEMIYWHTEELFYIGDIYEDIPSDFEGVDGFMDFNGWKKVK